MENIHREQNEQTRKGHNKMSPTYLHFHVSLISPRFTLPSFVCRNETVAEAEMRRMTNLVHDLFGLSPVKIEESKIILDDGSEIRKKECQSHCMQ